MKHLNEDIAITDPNLATQYSNGQVQVNNNEKKIQMLQKQINDVHAQNLQIKTKMTQIEQQAAKDQGIAIKSKEDAQAAAQNAVQDGATSESLLINDKTNLLEEKELLTDRIVTLHNKLADINKLIETEEEVRYTNKLVDGPGTSIMHQGNVIGHETIDVDELPNNVSDTDMERSDGYSADIRDLEREIDYLQDDIESLSIDLEDTSTRIGWEQEQTDTEIIDKYSWDVLDYLNGGNSDKKELEALGVDDPEYVINIYNEYHPDEELDLETSIKAKKEITKLEKKIDELKNKISDLEEKDSKIWGRKTKTSKRFVGNNQSPNERGSRPSVGNMRESINPMSKEEFYKIDEHIVKDGRDSTNTRYFNKTTSNYNQEDYIFYLRAENADGEFKAKIFKLNPKGPWYGLVKPSDKQETNKEFEKITFDPNYDMAQIIEFLSGTYDNVAIVSPTAYNNDGGFAEVDVPDFDVFEKPSHRTSIPTLDQYTDDDHTL